MLMQSPSAETVQTIWMISLVVFVVVLLVVATLLTLILRTTYDIRGGVTVIWNVGQRIANNTIQLSQLATTNAAAKQILDSAVGVLGATAAIRAHAEVCPGCPTCVVGPRWQR